MIEILRIREVNKQIANEAEHLEKVKNKLQMIKRIAVTRKDHQHHDSVILSGGYYMFDDTEAASEQASTSTIHDNSVTKISFKLPPRREVDKPSDSSASADHLKGGTMNAVKRYFSEMLENMVIKMRECSRNYRFILKQMHLERRTLKASLTPELTDSSVHDM